MAIKFLNTATGITEAAGDNSTKIATTAYVDAAASAIPIGNYLPLSAGSSEPLTGPLYIPHYIYHVGDAGTFMGFPSNDRLIIGTDGATRVDITNSGFCLGDSGSNISVSTILDEDDMASDSATALVTQQSIKAYVDAHPGSGGTVTSVSGTGSVSGLTLTGTVTSSGDLTLGGTISGFTPLNDIRSLGTPAFTNGTNPNITTAQVMAEIEGDGGFDSYSSVFKTSWSYAGNYNLTDAGDFTETAGSSWLTWTDNSSDSTRGNITTLAIAPNTGGSAGGVFIYNDQGASYSPGWRQVWTSTTDGAGSGLDADLLDGQEGSYYATAASLGNYLPIANPTFTGTLTGPAATITTVTGALAGNASTSTTFSTGRTNYKGVTDGAVAGQLMWKEYGNNHTIFDASDSTSPSGSAISNTDSAVAWTGTYPTLMGWNGSSTYGVRVDRARLADNATTAAAYLPLVGGAMTGNIAMGNNQITGIDELQFNSGVTIETSATNNYLDVIYSNTGAGGIRLWDGDSTVQGYLYGDGGATSSFGLLHGSGAWAVRCLENSYVELRNNNVVKLTTSTSGVTVSGTLTADQVGNSSTQTRDKLRVWGSSSYSISMMSGYGYGGLGGNTTGTDYAMSFQMSNSTDRGWWWGDTTHTNLQGAMSLTTTGKAVIATSLSIGYGETTRTAATQALEVNGTVVANQIKLMSGTTAYLNTSSYSSSAYIYGYATGSTIYFGQPATWTQNIQVQGTATATNFILSSDKTLKNKIKEIDTNHIDVNWKNFELKSEPGVKRAGVIAQELEEKHPEFVRTDDEGIKSVAYIDLLITKIAELEARLEKAGI